MSKPTHIPRAHAFFIQTPILEKLRKSKEAGKWNWSNDLLRLAVQIACTPALLGVTPYREKFIPYWGIERIDGTLAALTSARDEVNRMLKSQVGVVRFFLQCPQYGFLREEVSRRNGKPTEPSAKDIIKLLAQWGYPVSENAVRTARKEQHKKISKLKMEVREAKKFKRRMARAL
jgi:hypothetical protein